SLTEVINQPALADVPFRRDVEAPNLPIAARAVIAVHDVQGLAVRRDRDAVGFFDLRLTQNAGHPAVRVDAVDAFAVHLHARAVSVAGVGKPDTSLAVHADIVGAVVAFAVVTLGQDRDAPRFHVGADHAAAPARPEPKPFAADEPALSVEGVAVGPSAVR